MKLQRRSLCFLLNKKKRRFFASLRMTKRSGNSTVPSARNPAQGFPKKAQAFSRIAAGFSFFFLRIRPECDRMNPEPKRNGRMYAVNNRERVRAVLNFEMPDDRLPMIEWATWWDKTIRAWETQGLPPGLPWG